MGKNTNISWCDHTFNPWIGCTKISPGCEHCYAERENIRYHWNHAGWGPNAPRKLTSDANWKMPLKWDRDAEKDGVIRRVFCASLADIFDKKAPQEWRERLWKLIDQTPHLEWLLLTKRPDYIKSMIPNVWFEKPQKNVRMMVTAENQQEADFRIPMLIDSWNGKNGVSVEPMLGHVDLDKYLPTIDGRYPFPLIDWVICGGESGPGARPMHPAWARSLRDQCDFARVPFLFKQWGEWSPYLIQGISLANREQTYFGCVEFYRYGKSLSGHLLDGREYMGFPR